MKYIIESNDVIGYTPKYAMLFGDGYMIQPLEDLEELNSDYINEHFGDLQDDAYKRGINDGSLDVKQRVEGAYQRGLDDAWEAAKKIFGYEIDGGIPIDEAGRVFGYSEDATFCTADIFRHNTVSEAIEKLKAYEEKQKADDEIKVGDVVMIKQFKHPENHLFVVTKVSDESVWGIEGDGSWNYWAINEVIKTDKHFDIVSILEAMKA